MRIYIIIFIIVLQCSYLWANTCTKIVGHLGSAQKDFVYCATTNAVPVHICIACEPAYTDMVMSYGVLTNNTNCSAEYFDHDKINIVSTTQSILLGLWTKAYCDDCFNNNHSQTFDDLVAVFETCLGTNIKSDVCDTCSKQYDDLNTYYTQLDQTNNAKVCFDMTDKMNSTRIHWSKDLKCCKHEPNMVVFLCCSISMAVLPLIFYIGIYAYGKRRENVHDVLNNEDAETTSPRAPNPSHSEAPIQSGSSTPSNTTRESRNTLQKKSVPADDSESDESNDYDLRKRL